MHSLPTGYLRPRELNSNKDDHKGHEDGMVTPNTVPFSDARPKTVIRMSMLRAPDSCSERNAQTHPWVLCKNEGLDCIQRDSFRARCNLQCKLKPNVT